MSGTPAGSSSSTSRPPTASGPFEPARNTRVIGALVDRRSVAVRAGDSGAASSTRRARRACPRTDRSASPFDPTTRRRRRFDSPTRTCFTFAVGIARAVEGGVAEVVIDRPPVNALDAASWQALADAVRALGDDAAVRVGLLRAHGRRFSPRLHPQQLPRPHPPPPLPPLH